MKIRKLKILAVFLAAIMVIASSPLPALAVVSEDFWYIVLDDGTAEIMEYTGCFPFVTIPDKVDGYKITSIRNNAFENCS